MRVHFVPILAAALAAGLGPRPAAADDAARTAQLRLLCVQLSGDLTEPGGMAAFRRCLADLPVAAMRQNAAPAPASMPPLVKPGVALTQGAAPADRCAAGFVWREATADDHVCVVPATRAAARADNAAAPGRVQR